MYESSRNISQVYRVSLQNDQPYKRKCSKRYLNVALSEVTVMPKDCGAWTKTRKLLDGAVSNHRLITAQQHD